MTRPTVIYWPPSGPDVNTLIDIAEVQNVANGSFVQLKANNPGLSTGYFSYSNIVKDNYQSSLTTNIIRSIKIKYTSAGLVNFIITGIGTPVDALGNPTGLLQPITETINAIIGVGVIDESQYIYTQINSIQVSGSAVTNLSVGYGSFGITTYVKVDYNRIANMVNGWSLQFIPNPAAAGMEAAVYMSLNTPEMPSKIGTIIPHGLLNGTELAFIPAFVLEAPTDQNTFGSLGTPVPYSVIWATITDCTTDAMIFTFLQPGLTA
jgi:hypothetical protein